MTDRSILFRWLFLLLAAGLVLIRVPSLAQPAGADQALYAYVGQRLAAGAVPYRDAWDQKPPGIHAVYAVMFTLWPRESVVPLTDLVVSVVTAVLLVGLGRRLGGRPGAGQVAAVLYLLLANPALGRLGGVRVRSQAETFIGLAIAAALWMASGRRARERHTRAWLGAGGLLGFAVLLKYNAVVYAAPLVALGIVALDRRESLSSPALAGGRARSVALLALGAVVPALATLAYFGLHGAVDDLYRATVVYNLRYSGETYAGPGHVASYLLSFPVSQASLDPLWLVGGAGSALLLLAAIVERRLAWALAPAWVAAACVAIALNGSRGLPQYFVQAAPALALAAGLGGTWLWARVGRPARIFALVVVSIAVWRVATFPKVVDYTRWDLARLTGRLDDETYLSRFGGADSGDKYSALAVHRLADTVARETDPDDTVLVFGFSPWALVGSGRLSASRFFWSRPVIIGFGEGRPGYGADGLLADLEARRPRLVVLQRRDWDPDGPNSADYFLGHPRLSAWLRAGYRQTRELHNFLLWTRNDAQ